MGFFTDGTIDMNNYDSILNSASKIALENGQASIEPAHLFKVILRKDGIVRQFIEDVIKKDYWYCIDWAEIRISQLEKSVVRGGLQPSKAASAVLHEAENYMSQVGLEEPDDRFVLAALATPGVGFSFDQLKSLPITSSEVIEGITKTNKSEGTTIKKRSTPSADVKYCTDIILNFKECGIPSIIGFENEISSIIDVLSRKHRSNILITGESGVGKTSLVEGFVARLVSGEVPAYLADAKVYSLDLNAVSVGASYNGEIEDRIKKVIDTLTDMPGSILVVEGLDKMFDKQGTFNGATRAIKQSLSEGGLMWIATASIDGFTKHLETDKELTSKFDRISLDPPNDDACFRILKGVIQEYEEFHGLHASDGVLHQSIRLAKRYLPEKALPSSAIDLIDRTMAQIKAMNDTSNSDIQVLESKLDGIVFQHSEEQSTELTWFHYELFNRLSCLLTSQIEDDTDFHKIDSIEAQVAYLKKVIAKLKTLVENKRTEVVEGDLFAVIAKQTGIPLGKVQSKERDKLMGGEEILKRRVVGQDPAIKIVLDAIYESRSGLTKKGQPIGSFFFLGPTGTGKTELTKSLVEFLFGDESALLRFDMSEYKEEHSVALLYGAPPGYVGYEEGGLLVNKIRQHPYSVVLFDEIEKAHKSVFDLFLQILDEGKLHDRLGRVGDFSNALIVFTSNIGSEKIVEYFDRGVVPERKDLMPIMEGNFRPEFLARLTEIVPFAPITEKMLLRIFDIHLGALCKQLEEQHITLTVDEESKMHISQIGFNPRYGARTIIGTIRTELRRPLSKLIISGQLKPGDTVTAEWKNSQIIFSINNKVL